MGGTPGCSHARPTNLPTLVPAGELQPCVVGARGWGPCACCCLLGCGDFLAEHLQALGEAIMEVMLLGTGGPIPVTCCWLCRSRQPLWC